MKKFLAKQARPAFAAVLTLVLMLTLSVSSAFAMVDISDKFYITDEADVISAETEEYIYN